MKSPLFSIIVPTHNRLHSLSLAISSVMNQTFRDFEIILVNDYPPLYAEIDELYGTCSEIQIIHHERSLGGSTARNTGLKHARGELIAFLDDDDTWELEKLQKHFEAHEQNPLAGLIFSDCRFTYGGITSSHIHRDKLPDNLLKSMSVASFCPCTTSIVSIRKECIQQCGLFDDSLQSFQDWDYWFRIAHQYEFSHIPRILVNFHQHSGDRTSRNSAKRRRGLEQVCVKWRNEIDLPVFRKKMLISIYFTDCMILLMNDDRRQAFYKSFSMLRKEVLGAGSLKKMATLFVRILLKRVY